MNEIDTSLIKANVKKLFDDSGLKQTEFAGIIDTSQSYLSKLLNPKDNACYSLHQLYKIAKHFNISLDQLVGIHDINTQVSSFDARQICALIAHLINDDILTIHSTKIKEDNAYVIKTDDCGNELYCQAEKESYYCALYFSNYNKINTRFNSEDDYYEYQDILRDCGNDHETNLKVNAFLSTYTELYRLYQIGQLSKEAFHDMQAALINNIK